MQPKLCPNGHYYDPEKYSSCPQCGGAGGAENHTMPLVGDPSVHEAYGKTQPIGGSVNGHWEQIPATGPVEKFGGEPMSEDGFGGWRDTGETVVKPPEFEINPTVGWVIIVRGPNKGRDYRLNTGYNKIGRAPEMKICLENDEKITRDTHAILVYDDTSRKFFVYGGENLTYVNGKLAIEAHELKSHDVIRVGSTELMFVPLCGEDFSW